MLRCGHIMGEADIALGGGCLCRKNGSSCWPVWLPHWRPGGLIVWTVTLFRRVRPAADWLLAPYLLWVSFTDYLNAGIWLLN